MVERKQQSEKGYEISLDKARNILHVRVWGDWNGDDTELAENFKRELQEKVEEASVDGKEWEVHGDLAEFLTQSKEVRGIVSKGIEFAIRHGMKKAVHLES